MPIHRLLAAALVLVLGACRAEAPPLPTAEQRRLLDPQAEEAIAATLELARARPRSGAARGRLGMIYHAHALYEPSAASYRQAMALDPASGRWPYLLAHVLVSLGDLDAAVQAARQCLQRQPDYLPAYWPLGSWLLNLGRLAEAESVFRHATERAAHDPAGRLGLARVALQRGDAADAADRLERLVHEYPDFGYAYQLLAAAYRELGRASEATLAQSRSAGSQARFPDPWLAEVRATKSGYRAAVEQAQALLDLRRVSEAILLLEAQRSRHPTDFALLYTLGTAFFAAGRLDEAASTFALAREHHPEAHLPALSLGAVAEMRGELDAALTWTDRAIALHPAYGNSHRQRARILWRRRDPQGALEAIDRALRHDPRNLEFHQLRLQLLRDLGHWPEALHTAERLTRDWPFWVPGFLLQAEARAETGDLAGAREALAAARDLGAPAAQIELLEERLRDLGSESGA